MELMRSKNPKIPLEKLRVSGKTEALFFWEQEFLGAAYWFAGIPEFMELDLSIKVVIFMHLSENNNQLISMN